MTSGQWRVKSVLRWPTLVGWFGRGWLTWLPMSYRDYRYEAVNSHSRKSGCHDPRESFEVRSTRMWPSSEQLGSIRTFEVNKSVQSFFNRTKGWNTNKQKTLILTGQQIAQMFRVKPLFKATVWQGSDNKWTIKIVCWSCFGCRCWGVWKWPQSFSIGIFRVSRKSEDILNGSIHDARDNEDIYIYIKSHDHEWLALVEQEENEKGNMQKRKTERERKQAKMKQKQKAEVEEKEEAGKELQTGYEKGGR